MDEFVNQEFKQKCGDTLFVIEETEQRTSYGAKLYRCKFLKHPYEVLVPKSDVKKGNIANPQIEKEEFWDKIHIQNNGDKLKVLEKTQKRKGRYFLYKCISLIYNNILYLTKPEIQTSQIVNPIIEQIEFVNKIWPQNCGDSLRIIEKTDQTTSKNNHHFLWKCRFIKYPYEVLAEKGNILKGTINNPLIDKIEFMSKKWKQHCGGEIEVLEKEYGDSYKCRFVGYNRIYKASKGSIKEGIVLNRELPWFSKESLHDYIKKNFKDKPSFAELSNSLKISNSHLNNKIIEFGLKEDIKYFPEGSKDERLIKDYIQSLLPQEKISNSWTELGNGQEIDIFIPSLRLGIEYNGNYWHSSLFKEPNYHQEKSSLAQSKDIFLMHIFEYEWTEKQNICKTLIKSRLGIFDKKIEAKECEVKGINDEIYKNFCIENSLQEEAEAKIKLGLYYKDELIQIMSFDVPCFTNKFEWEIVRECSKLGYIILGGKEKLWKYFIKNYNPINCISYCDFSKFSGESYAKLGFKKERLNKSGFVWYDEKNNCILRNQEHEEKALKIYDCGQLVFTWIKS